MVAVIKHQIVNITDLKLINTLYTQHFDIIELLKSFVFT